MDLREKVSFIQKVSEYSIRFRLLEILFAVLLCAIARLNIDGILVALRPLASGTETIIAAFVNSDFSFISRYGLHGIAFAVLALFVFRWIFFGFKCGLLWFFFLFFNGLLLIVIGEYIDIMQIVLACILIVAITFFIFIHSLMAKSIFPLIVLVYSLSVWMLFLGISNSAWVGLVSMLCADTFHLVFVIALQVREDAKNKKTLNGAIIHGVRKIIPVSMLSIALLIVMEIVFYFMNLPMMASGNILSSMAIYICYILWMPCFTIAVLSFCPLENTCKIMQKKSK
jgi:hypothetical protein